MGLGVIVGCSLAYIILLFVIAWRVDQHAKGSNSAVSNPYIYALSLAVYCTAWTFFGSVGRAATGGLIFLGVYLGPTLLAPLWYILVRKMILISKHQRISSIADFISSRYGKSSTLAAVVTIIIALGIVPYISLQLKAVIFGINTLIDYDHWAATGQHSLWSDAGFYVTIAMALFTVVFATRKLDPNERHEGMVAAIAFESLIKLIAFMLVGFFVTYGIYNGFEDLFSQALARADTARLFTFNQVGVSPLTWNMLLLLSLLAIIMLPRQFHISVVENTSVRHLPKAMWVFPLYLLLINIFVFPIALAGKMLFDAGVNPDTYVLNLPLHFGAPWLALLAFIGGFSAATSMIVIESTALSIMFSNHLVVPLLIRIRSVGKNAEQRDGAARLLNIRRFSILFVLFLAYGYQKLVGNANDLVSVGLISFTAVAQLAPATIGGMYWMRATKQGALAGLLTGFVVWAYCLPLPGMAQAGIIPDSFVEDGLFGISFLRPYALFGLGDTDPITHAAFWSLLLNTWVYAIVSINTRPSTLNLTQANLFVHIYKYMDGQEMDILKREATLIDVQHILVRFMGEGRAKMILDEYTTTGEAKKIKNSKMAHPDLIQYAEKHLAGAIGAASARLVMDSISKQDTISLEEVMRILEQTKEAVAHSRVVEAKNKQLEHLAQQLTIANEQLKQLDQLKADFITTVTHELRTPVTSIKALSKIMLDYGNELPPEKIQAYLAILVDESERISRLINQVLDLEKIQQTPAEKNMELIDLGKLATQSMQGLEQLFVEKGIQYNIQVPEMPVWIKGHRDNLIQVVLNLLSNALKFCDPVAGKVNLNLQQVGAMAVLQVQDNGAGVPENDRQLIFEKFTQLHHLDLGKPKGTGLGLFISKTIIQQHGGTLQVMANTQPGAVFELKLPLANALDI
jgi:Na+/proline symporter/signal transduction histidine kinase